MKKFVVILLCVFTLAGTALVYPVYQYFLSEVKLQSQLLTHSALSKEQIVSISIAKKDANLKNGFKRTGDDEIQYRGHMYDVVAVLQHSDTTVYQCISDHNEDMLNSVFTQVLNLNTDHPNLPISNQKSVAPNCIQEFLICAVLRADYISNSITLFERHRVTISSQTYSDVLYSPPEKA